MNKEEFVNGWLSHIKRPNYPQKSIDLMNKELDEMILFEAKKLEQSHQADVSGSLSPIKDAVDFAKWVRDNTIADGAPKLFLRQYEKVNKDKSRYTMEELYDVYRSGNDR